MEFINKAWFNFVTLQQAEEAERQGNTIEAVHKRGREILKGKVVIGFDVKNDFRMLALKPPFPFLVRDIQKHFNTDRCSEPDMCRLGLRKLTKNLIQCCAQKAFSDRSSSDLADARATLALYIWDRHRIDTS